MKRRGITLVFLWPALAFGCVFAFLIPPFQSPDEPSHFLRAYQISEGVFSPEKYDRRLGGDLPVSLASVCDSFSFLKMNYAARLDKKLIFNSLNIPLQTRRRAFTDFPNTAIYAPTAYLPQAAAIALLRPLGATPLQMLYACRLANLLVWTLLVMAALRLMPFMQNTLAALALLPSSLVIAASANADVVTNGLCWWLIAGFCAGNWSGLKNPAAWAIVCANKLIALPLMLLHWLWAGAISPASRLHLKRFVLLFFAGFFAALAWGRLAQKWFIPYDDYHPVYRDAQTLNEGVDPARQQAFMLQNPLYFAKTAALSAMKALPSTAAHMVGKFGWEKNYLSPLWLALLWLAVTVLVASDGNPISGRQRLLAAGVTMLYVGAFAVTMYALWCPVGAGEVTNFQGRYFVPVLPVAALAVAGGWLGRWRDWIMPGVYFVLIISNLAMIMHVWERYYG